MSIELILYLVNILDNFNVFMGCLVGIPAVVAFAILFFTGIDYIGPYDNTDNVFFKVVTAVKKYIGWWIFLLFLAVIIPSERTMYLMIGANYFKNSTLPPKIEAIIEKKLDQYLLEDLTDKKKGHHDD